MKNTKNAFAMLLFAVILVFGACKEAQKPEQPEPEKPREKVKPPQQIISLEASKELFDNYSRNRVDLIKQFEMEKEPDVVFRPARFTSYDYATIKQYMDFIEQEAKSAHVDISSLRFYFGNYPNEEKFRDGKKVVHPRQNSIFIVPAMKVDGQEYGFYIGEDGKAKLIKDAVGAQQMGSSEKAENKAYASFAPSFTSAPPVFAGQSLTLNRGNAGPPPDADY